MSNVESYISSIREHRSAYERSGFGQDLKSTALNDTLARYESPGLTARRARSKDEIGVERDPIVLSRGEGSFLWDADGLVYVDMGACFAVAAYGHAQPELVEALHVQAQKLMHAMGDVYPSDSKIAFLERLADFTPGYLSLALLSQSGAEAVESAIKMAQMATKKHRILAFESSYHGLSYGALSLTAHQNSFKDPFAPRICDKTTYLPYPKFWGSGYDSPEALRDANLKLIAQKLDHPASGCGDVAAIIVEPIQGRGGDVVPPKGWLWGLSEICKERGILLIVDEIYTGFGRTGYRFACDAEGVAPDIMCLGKAMTGGFPLSAALATPEVLRHWPLNTSEAIHTSTFLGNPMGCAVGLKALEILERDQLVERSYRLGLWLESELKSLAQRHRHYIAEVRGRGLMWGIELADHNGKALTTEALAAVDALRSRGIILLPSGPQANVISIAPALNVPEACLGYFVEALDEVLSNLKL